MDGKRYTSDDLRELTRDLLHGEIERLLPITILKQVVAARLKPVELSLQIRGLRRRVNRTARSRVAFSDVVDRKVTIVPRTLEAGLVRCLPTTSRRRLLAEADKEEQS